MLNPIQIVALNVLVTTGLFAVLKVAGMSWLPAFLWAFIGGGVITLYCAVTLVVVIERRSSVQEQGQERKKRSRQTEIAMWEEDVLDEMWDATRLQHDDAQGLSALSRRAIYGAGRKK